MASWRTLAFSCAALVALALTLPCANAIRGESICGITFSDDAHSFRDSSDREILAVDAEGNVYIGSLGLSMESIPSDANGISVKSGASAKWFFNYTNAYVAGAVLQRAQAMPAAQGGDVAFRSAAGSLLALLQGSSGNLTAKGYIVIDGGSANCPADGLICKTDGSIYSRHNFCNVTQSSKGTCEYADTPSAGCTDACVDFDPGTDTSTKGFINDTELCSSGTACPYMPAYDFCQSGTLHNRTCSGADAGSDIETECSSGDKCEGASMLYYTCSDSQARCVQESVACSGTGNRDGDGVACNCDCGFFDAEENLTKGNCNDGLDNDCDGAADLQDRGCCTDECPSLGITGCEGGKMKTCVNRDQDACFEWSLESDWVDCSQPGDTNGNGIGCKCQCGAYDIDESAASGKCNDGLDNDCDGAADYDGGGKTAKGDPGCTISMEGIAVAGHPQPVCTNAGEEIRVECTPNVTNNNCVTAMLADVACSKKDPFWVDGKAVFSCMVATSTTQDCNSPGALYHTAKCYIDTQKCNTNLGVDSKTVAVYAKPSVCGGYTDATTCAANGCEWCPTCSGKKSSGLQTATCVKLGECPLSCVTGYCGATCQAATDFKLEGSNCQYSCAWTTSCSYTGSASTDSKCDQGTRYYGGTCTGSDVSFSTENCNNHDTDNCWYACNSGTGNVDNICDDWTCSGAACVDSGTDWTKTAGSTICAGCIGSATPDPNAVGNVNVSSSCTKRNPAWLYKRPLTLNLATPSSDYQVRVALTSSFSYAKAKADGSDVRFYDVNGNKLSYWTESWNAGGTSVFWVKVPSAGTATLYMYYGNSAATSESSSPATFAAAGTYAQEVVPDATTKGLWHMNNNWYDSSPNAKNGIAYSATFTTASKLGSHAGNFDGSNDYVYMNVYGNYYFTSAPFTITAWIKPTSLPTTSYSYYPVMCSGNPNSLPAMNFWVTYNGGPKLRFILRDSAAAGYSEVYGATTLTANTWYHIAAVRDGATMKVYLNGFLDGSNPNGPLGSVGSTSDVVYLGMMSYSTSYYFKGILDEVRISTTALSAADIMKDAGIRKTSASDPIVSVGNEISNAAGPACDTFTESDTCISSSVVKEFYCQNNAKTSLNVACDSGKACSSGRCA